MADDSPNYGRIKPGDADAVLYNALSFLCFQVVRGEQDDTAFHLIKRTLPMASASSRMVPIVEAAHDVVKAYPARLRSGGTLPWTVAMMDLRTVMARDALAQAVRRLD